MPCEPCQRVSLKRTFTEHSAAADGPHPEDPSPLEAASAPAMHVAPQPTLTRLQHGAHTLDRLAAGARNEDTFLATTLQLTDAVPGAAPLHLLAVFDGHSSASVSSMLMQDLPGVLTQLLGDALAAASAAASTAAAAAGPVSTSSGSSARLDVDAVMPQVLVAAFEQLDACVPALDNAGSTATVAVLTPQQLHLAWVGDSRGVLLGQGGRVISFTHEHRATREDETERVQAAGGTVLNNSGLRVMGILQCTRAIGDKDLRQYGVIPTPDVLSLPRTGQEEFLVLATDGLWDVVSNEEVYDYAVKAVHKVQDRLTRQRSPTNDVCAGCKAAGIAARALSSVARKQRRSRDDITVIVANLGASCSCTNPPATLSSATAGSSSSLLASSSTGGPHDGSAQHSDSIAAGVQLHSSPAALGLQQPTDAAAAAATDAGPSQLQQHPHPQEQHTQQQGLFKPPKQPQQSLPATRRLPARPPQQHCKRAPGAAAGAVHGPGLLLQPSVCPGPASAVYEASAHHHNMPVTSSTADGLQHSLLSDLAMSSPFAMMLSSAAVAEVEVEVDLHLDLVSPFSTAGSGGVVSGGSAPPALEFVAAALVPSGGSSGARKHSLSVALGNSRSCGSVGAPPLGPLSSTEPPVVVLT